MPAVWNDPPTDDEHPGRSAAIIAGLVMALVVVVDVVTGHHLVLIPTLVACPLLAATNGRTRQALFVGAAASAAAIALGPVDGIWGTSRHLVGIGAVVFATGFAWGLARLRNRREAALRRARPAVERSARLARAMHVGRMGEWRWDVASGEVWWDDELHRLFGLEPGRFGGHFDDWAALLHDDDRATVLQNVAAGVAGEGTFRFDHRCVWPSGEVHWVEGLGDVVLDERGVVAGAVGLAWNVDERHAQLDDRARLLDIERVARQRAEYLARVHGVLTRSVDVHEILSRVTESAVPDLGEWCAAVLAFDQPPDQPIIVTAHSDPKMRDWAEELRRQQPYDPDAPFGAAKVIRTGQRELLERLADFAMSDAPAARVTREALVTADVDAVLTVPIVGPLGVLGSMQVIRGRARHSFPVADIELVEELASRCGSALHTAILFSRQARSRAALETLQLASGWLARAVTTSEVARAVVTSGVSGMRAEAGVVYQLDDANFVELAADGQLSPEVQDALHRLATRCLGGEQELSERLDDAWLLAIPLRVRNRTNGALGLVFELEHVPSDEERSMTFTLASRCAGALERAALYERDRDIALTLQRRLLPRLPAMPEWLEAGGSYAPATGGQIGGDWFQLLEVDDGRLVATVGDAVGHGMTSAAAMGQLRASLATAVFTDDDPAAALDVVEHFADQAPDTRGASVGMVVLSEMRPLRYASAGHPPAVLLRSDGRTELLEHGRRPLLGFGNLAAGAAATATATADFDPGDTLIMYTDGLVERRRELIDIGLARLRATVSELRELSPQALCDELVARMRHEGRFEDDVAVLVIRRR